MPDPAGTKAGIISKPYGLKGEVSMILEPRAGKCIKTEYPLFINIDGQRIPFFMEDFEQVSPDQVIIKFEFINSLDQAKEVSGCEVFLDPRSAPDTRDESIDVYAVIGYKAFDKEMLFLGEVTEYLHHDLNPVLVIAYKGRDLLIPAAPGIIDKINHRDRSIHFVLPEGLIQL